MKIRSIVSRPQIRILPDASALAETGADLCRQAALTQVREKGRFTLALSGGQTPRALHRLLAEEPYLSSMPWHKTHLFWVDDRMVPVDDPESNYGTAKRDFIDKIPIPSSHVHPMPVDLPAQTGAKRYASELRRFFKGASPILDLIFMGIGTDGHTASLFPGEAAPSGWVAAAKGGHPNVFRITLTFNLLNQAHQVVFLVSGKDKAKVVKAVLEDADPAFPAGGVQPTSGNLIWLLDPDAASLLKRKDPHAAGQ